MLHHILNLSRSAKRTVAVVIDCACLIFAFWFAQSVRFEQLYPLYKLDVWLALSIAIPISLLVFSWFGLYRVVVRYLNSRAQISMVVGVLASTGVLYFSAQALGVNFMLSSAIIYAMTGMILVGSSRNVVRTAYELSMKREKQRVIVFGAGSAGRQLARALQSGQEYFPVAFVDDDETLHGSSMLGLRVYDPKDLKKWVKEKNVNRVLLAIPSTSRSNRKRILEMLEPLNVQVQTIPGMTDMVDGDVRIDELQDVRIEDLLGRDPVAPNEQLMDANIRGKVVMVTGAGGSIGSELCRQIIKYKPKSIVLYELSEFGLYSIDQELRQLCAREQLTVSIHPVIGTVQRRNRIEAVLRSFGVNTVYHAAAYKHVPLVEYNVVEGVRNNVFGTWHTAEAALAAGVENLVLISTDKAVRPTNTMGATKRMAELVLQALAKREAHNNAATHFSMVRFGNVLGSSGSVVPLFREQIEKGGPITVTHPDIIRYFMTIPEAAQLVIQAGAMSFLSRAENLRENKNDSTGGDVFVLDMGEPVRIADLAEKMINLMGLEVKSEANPNGDIAIKYTGLRPGEKLYEELLIGDNVSVTAHGRIMTALEKSLDWQALEAILNQLDTACHEFKISTIRELLLKAPTDFEPSDGICDLVWLNSEKENSLPPEALLQSEQKHSKLMQDYPLSEK
ncbi:MAG: nucleoside-diphosphate sugar epimerase/dehydratase [Idiomarina sp.]